MQIVENRKTHLSIPFVCRQGHSKQRRGFLKFEERGNGCHMTLSNPVAGCRRT